jgi:cyclopropane-fatty-acyl-phospholipid synthase
MIARALIDPFQTAGREAAKQAAIRILSVADVKIGGDRPWDIQVIDERFYDRTLNHGALGFGESYVDGWWECDALDELVHRILRFDLEAHVKRDWRAVALLLRAKASNMQSPLRAKRAAAAHYDLGNDFYERMLGPSMVYSCAYWKDAADLDAAQEAKLALVCDKLGIGPGDRVLDVGCGWGAFARFAAERRGCVVTGVTVAPSQAAYARDYCKGLPVEILTLDYRSRAIAARGPFNKIVSLGMFEHVGKKNYGLYMDTIRGLLAEDGLFLLQTIGRRVSTDAIDVFIDKYIFPNGVIPSPSDLTQAFEPRFVLEDWHSFGPDYEKTLLAWFENFDALAKSPDFKLGQRFYRTWKYYLLSFAGAFRARTCHQVWQIVLSPEGCRRAYRSVR